MVLYIGQGMIFVLKIIEFVVLYLNKQIVYMIFCYPWKKNEKKENCGIDGFDFY